MPRLCVSGMRRKTKGAKIVLSLRALTNTVGRWTQFWQRIDQFGAACFGRRHYCEAARSAGRPYEQTVKRLADLVQKIPGAYNR